MIGTVIRRPAGSRPARTRHVVETVIDAVKGPKRRGWDDLTREVHDEMRRLGADPRPTWREKDWRGE